MSLTNDQIESIVDATDSLPELSGVAVFYNGNQACSIVDSGDKTAFPYWQFVVVIEEIPGVGALTVSASPADVPNPPAAITNRSQMWVEFKGACFDCSFAALGVVTEIGAAAAELPSSGTSTFAMVAAWTPTVTAGLLCVNAIVRSAATKMDPDSDSLSQWDKNRVYAVACRIADAIVILHGLWKIGPSIRSLLTFLSRRGALVSAEELARMGREARASAIQRALIQASKDKESAAGLKQALRDAGLTPRTIRRAAGNAIIAARNSSEIREVIADETARQLEQAVLKAIDSGGTLAVNAMPPGLVGSASVSVNVAGGFIVHVIGRAAASVLQSKRSS